MEGEEDELREESGMEGREWKGGGEGRGGEEEARRVPCEKKYICMEREKGLIKGRGRNGSEGMEGRTR